MAEEETDANGTTDIAAVIGNIAGALVPSSVKALNRLVGAVIDIPVAYTERVSERVRAKTKSYVAVENAVAGAAERGVLADEATMHRAMDALVAREYRKQESRESVAKEFVAEMQHDNSEPAPDAEIDDDWLNVFERYAEDASTERMQQLWGKVLAGEVRKPGRFSMRTLRFLSEFSQNDALLFADFCDLTFGVVAPTKLLKPNAEKDIRHLLHLEASGLISGASGVGFNNTRVFGNHGFAFIVEDDLAIQFKGEPGQSLVTSCFTLTPMGLELTYLLPARDRNAAARQVALAVKQDNISAAYISAVDASGGAHPIEVLWGAPPT
jgi:hypothetical protein